MSRLSLLQDHPYLAATIGVVFVSFVSGIVFFTHGTLYTVNPSANFIDSSDPSSTAISEACKAKENEATKATADVNEQITKVVQRMNEIGLLFGAEVPSGKTILLTEVASNQYDTTAGMTYKQEVDSLDSRYASLTDTRSSIETKYNCESK